jgi:hypothetical protein
MPREPSPPSYIRGVPIPPPPPSRIPNEYRDYRESSKRRPRSPSPRITPPPPPPYDYRKYPTESSYGHHHMPSSSRRVNDEHHHHHNSSSRGSRGNQRSIDDINPSKLDINDLSHQLNDRRDRERDRSRSKES